MRAWSIITEGWRMARSHLVPTLLLIGVLAIMVATALSTVGTGIAGAERVREEMEEAGARVLVATDNTGEGGYVTSAVTNHVASMSTVDSVVAFGLAFDTTFGPHAGGDPLAAWEVSDVETIAEIVEGRSPRPGEAVVTDTTAERWAMSYPAGYLVDEGGREYPIVGIASLRRGFSYFDTGSLVAASTEDFRSLHVVVQSLGVAEETQREVVSAIGVPSINQLSVSTPTGLRMSAELVNSNLAAQNRAMTALIIGVGAFVIGSVGLADVLLSRRDLGRRRALGASRADLVAVTLTRILVPAFIGAAIGAIATLVFYRLRGTSIGLDVAAAFIILAVTISLIASVAPAVWAARRDPVVVLRTP